MEFPGDGSKAIFIYIADERVDFRQLIKNFMEEFHIRVEMKQIGARQEAGLIEVLERAAALLGSRYMNDFHPLQPLRPGARTSLNLPEIPGTMGKLMLH